MKKTPSQKQLAHLYETIMYGNEYDLMTKEEVSNHYGNLVHKMNDELSCLIEILSNIGSQIELANKHTYGIDEVMVYVQEIERQVKKVTDLAK
jgi:hypothetical protein